MKRIPAPLFVLTVTFALATTCPAQQQRRNDSIVKPADLPEKVAILNGKYDERVRVIPDGVEGIALYKNDPNLDRILREVAWQSVSEHPLSGIKK